MVSNISASIIERLKNVARANYKPFNLITILYFQERFLKRLSLSDYKENFILKGGLYLYSVTQFKSRPTRDMDFSGRRLAQDSAKMLEIISLICEIQPDDGEDGIVFELEKMTAVTIKEDSEYEGVRIKIPCLLGKMKETLQLDIRFGDAIVPNPQEIDFPTLLSTMDSPKIVVYTNDSVVAEKFEAMISLSVINSRMKDFFDVYTLAERFSFDGHLLHRAVSETFGRRQTPIEEESVIFQTSFVEDAKRIRMWSSFLKTQQLSSDDLPFDGVVSRIEDFLMPIYSAIRNGTDFSGNWDCSSLKWDLPES